MINYFKSTIDHIVDFVGGGCHASVVWKDANLRPNSEVREKRWVFDKHLAMFLMYAIYSQSRKYSPAQVRDLPKARIKI